MIVNIYPSKTYARVPLLSPTHYCWHSLYLTASIWSTNIFLYMHISRTFLPLFHLNATKSTTFMGVIDLFQIICALCMVQNQQLQIGLFRIIVRASSLTFDQHAVWQRACIWRWWKVFKLLCKALALHVNSKSCFLFKAALANTPRAEVTTKMLKLLVMRSTQISAQEQYYSSS